MKGRSALAACLLGAGLAWAGAPQVLAPAPGARLSGPAAWLVVRAERPPPVTLDGRPVALHVSADEVHHFRLAPLAGGAGTLRVGEGAERSLGGGTLGFHQGPGTACWDCHDGGDAGCRECHPTPQPSKHAAVLADGCARCHSGPARGADSVMPICLGCHPDYGTNRHGRLRHAVLSERDPLRPGRGMDCASCHDPHAPRCLSCLPRGELRDWCKTCHGRL